MQDDKEPQGNPWMKSVMIWSGILLAMLLVASMFGGEWVIRAGVVVAIVMAFAAVYVAWRELGAERVAVLLGSDESGDEPIVGIGPPLGSEAVEQLHHAPTGGQHLQGIDRAAGARTLCELLGPMVEVRPVGRSSPIPRAAAIQAASASSLSTSSVSAQG